MPKVRSLSDFNRNQNAIIKELQQSAEPIYLTKNGRSSLVVMDAEAFDRALSFKNDIHAREMRVYEGLLEGYENYQQGKTRAAKDANVIIRKAKGWA